MTVASHAALGRHLGDLPCPGRPGHLAAYVAGVRAEARELELGHSPFEVAPCPSCGGRVRSRETDGYCRTCATEAR